MSTIHTHCVPKKWGVNLSVIGDYVISVVMNKGIAERMDGTFKNLTDEEARKPIEALCNEKSNHRILVEKNPEKAREIERVFKKYFLIK